MYTIKKKLKLPDSPHEILWEDIQDKTKNK